MREYRDLRESTVRRIQREMAGLGKLESLEMLEERFIVVAGRIVPADCMCWNNWEKDWSRAVSIRSNGQYGDWLGRRLELFADVVGKHPVLANGLFPETANSVLRLSDFRGAGQFPRNPLFLHIYKHMDSRHQLAYSPSLLSDRRIVLTWNRRGVDFNDEEMAAFHLLGRKLDIIARGIEERQRLESVWKAMCGFVDVRVPALALNSLGTRDLRLIAQLARGRTVSSLARETGVRRDTVAKQLGGIRELLGLENQRQLLSMLADLRVGRKPNSGWPQSSGGRSSIS